MTIGTPLPRLYRIQHSPGYFFAGHLTDGTQVLMTVDGDDLVAFLFDAEGKYRETRIQAVSQETLTAMRQWYKKRKEEGGYGPSYDGINEWHELDQWATEMRLAFGVIAVQKFDLPEIGRRNWITY